MTTPIRIGLIDDCLVQHDLWQQKAKNSPLPIYLKCFYHLDEFLRAIHDFDLLIIDGNLEYEDRFLHMVEDGIATEIRESRHFKGPIILNSLTFKDFSWAIHRGVLSGTIPKGPPEDFKIFLESHDIDLSHHTNAPPLPAKCDCSQKKTLIGGFLQRLTGTLCHQTISIGNLWDDIFPSYLQSFPGSWEKFLLQN